MTGTASYICLGATTVSIIIFGMIKDSRSTHLEKNDGSDPLKTVRQSAHNSNKIGNDTAILATNEYSKFLDVNACAIGMSDSR